MSTVYIQLSYDPIIEVNALKEICAGLEEEGVPYLLVQETASKHCRELAMIAASSSALQVGIGIDATGTICVHHAKLQQQEPYLLHDLSQSRKAGKNAARLVKGLSLSL